MAGGLIMVMLGMLPKMAAFVEAIPPFVLGGAGLVMFGMVAATGIRILSTVDYKGNRNNLYIVALAIGFGLIPLVAPRWTQQMAHSLHPLLEQRHPADRDRRGGAEPVLQRGQGRHGRRHRRGQDRRSALNAMRRTKATLIYRRTKNLRAVQLLLGHSKLESTVRYLGIEVDDALEISEQTEI